MVVVDIETYDPHVKTEGAGYNRADGHITCIGIYDGKEAKVYRPDDLSFIPIIERADKVVCHNATYDVGWLACMYPVTFPDVEDTMIRDGLLYSGEKKMTLEACCKRHGIPGKEFDAVQRWWEETGHKGNAIEHMDEVPFEVQAPYCAKDCEITWRLYEVQQRELEEQGLIEVANLEKRVFPVTMRMITNGIRIDEERRKEVAWEFLSEAVDLENQMVKEYGLSQINSARAVKAVFEEEGVVSPVKTDGGADSFSKEALALIDHPLAQMLKRARTLHQIYNTFLDGSLAKTHEGRLYTQFIQTGRDEGGTITGRYSSVHPNLQNIPTSGSVRSVFIPEEGCMLGAYDYKQIEYRLFCHYAILYKSTGWELVKEAMDRQVDYHNWVMNEVLHWPSDKRKLAKTANFAMLYYMGEASFLRKNRSLLNPANAETVHHIYEEYFGKLHFVKPTRERIVREATAQGFIRTLSGRKHKTEWGFEYKSLNKKIQGDAADLNKEGLAEAEEVGIWNVLTPHLTVHDEVVFSIPPTKEGAEAKKELVNCMRTKWAKNLLVPIGVDAEEGPNWEEVK